MIDLRKVALEMAQKIAGKKATSKRRVLTVKQKKAESYCIAIHARLLKGEEVIYSTIDVEMFKWRFKEACGGQKIELEPFGKDTNMYKIVLV